MTLALLMLLSQTSAANCVGNACTVGQRGNDVTLGGQVKVTVGPLGDGGTAYLKPAIQGVPLVIQSEQPTGTSTAAAVTIQATNKHDGGTILSVKNGLAEVFAVGPNGVTVGGSSGLDGGAFSTSAISLSAATPIVLTNVTAPTSITSAVSAATASTSLAAFALQPVNALDATDLVLCVARSDGACLFTFAYNGKAGFPTNDVVGNAASDVTGFRGFSSVAGSGSAAITLTTEGARVGTGPDTYLAESGADIVAHGAITSDSTKQRGSCTLDGASPSKCTATVVSGATCVCGGKGTSAAAAVGCAASTTTTTATFTAANGLTSDVDYICF